MIYPGKSAPKSTPPDARFLSENTHLISHDAARLDEQRQTGVATAESIIRGGVRDVNGAAA